MGDDPTVLVRCESTKGPITVEVHPAWAPHGAKRFLDLVEHEYYSDIALFRVNPWIVQFGAVELERPGRWRSMIPDGRHHLPTILDDGPTDCGGRCTPRSLFDGALSYAGGGLDSRSAQIFIVHHRGKSQPLGESPWEVPFANVTHGLDIVRQWFKGYGDFGVDQRKIFARGNGWLRQDFPELDYIVACKIEKDTLQRGRRPAFVDPPQLRAASASTLNGIRDMGSALEEFGRPARVMLLICMLVPIVAALQRMRRQTVFRYKSREQ
mmetsp:Transcript_20295/g.64794  ORF Transcript_20295/g.64794 Transcript_20295/m.64794 type:complete len:267 (-) Transcript_20295:3915-4715(-)